MEMNRGPFIGAQPEPTELAAAARRPRSWTSARSRLRGRTPSGRAQRPRLGDALLDEGGFRARASPVVVVASGRRRGALAIRGLRSVGHLDIAGYVLGGGSESLELVSVEQLDALLQAGAELIDVREKDERDTGYIAGSRNIPYRLLALGEADLPRDRPIVTICETGPRAAIAASILAAHGFDAHPVVNGGIDSWMAAGKPTVEFRRCGG